MNFRPMLATTTDGTNISYPKLASPKLDGIRCIVINGVALSRSMKPIPNKYVQTLFGRQEFNGLDGELIVGSPVADNVFSTTTSAVMSHDGISDVWFHVFDAFTEPGGFLRRLRAAHKRIQNRESLVLVPHIEISIDAELSEYEAKCLSEGYEGVMLRDPNGPYKQGRSTARESYLLKLKQFEDAEAEIIAINELARNTNEAKLNELGNKERSHRKEGMVGAGTMGSLTVRDILTDVEFEVGTGFTARDREELWSQRNQIIGKLIKYKSQPTGVKDKPRFPVFLGFRDLIDL